MKKFVITILIFLLLAYPVLATQISSIISQGSGSSVRVPTQDFGFYAAGRYWVFFDENTKTKFQYKSSTDGITWDTPTIISTSSYFIGAMFDIYFDGTNVHYIRNGYDRSFNYEDIYYRRGVPQTDGSITWAVEQNVLVGSPPYSYYHGNDMSLTVDSNGYPWIGVQYGTGSTYGNAYVIKSSKNDGTWSTALNYPKLLNATPSNTWLVKLVSQTAGKVYAIIYSTVQPVEGIPYQIYGYAYNGSTWGIQETVTTSKLKNKFSGGEFDMMDAISDGDDIHLVFHAYSTNDIRYVKYTGGAWGSEEIIVQTANLSLTDSSPVLTQWDANTIYMFWIKRPVIYYMVNQNGTWDTTVRTFLTNENIVVDQERCLQVWNEPYNVNGVLTGGLFYLPTPSSVYQQTFVSFTSLTENLPPEDPPIGGTTDKKTIFKNNVIFNNNVIIKD